MIEFKDMTKVYVMGEEEVAALAGVTCQIERGEFTAVIGPSGSGKSSLMKHPGRSRPPTAGTYHFENEDVGHFTDDQLALFRNKRIGFIFQSFQLLPRLTASQNVELPMIYGGLGPAAAPRPRGRTSQQGRPSAAAPITVRRRCRRPAAAGGHRPRARQLAGLLLADEPTGALDTKTGQKCCSCSTTSTKRA